jgi:hypothetical protein
MRVAIQLSLFGCWDRTRRKRWNAGNTYSAEGELLPVAEDNLAYNFAA